MTLSKSWISPEGKTQRTFLDNRQISWMHLSDLCNNLDFANPSQTVNDYSLRSYVKQMSDGTRGYPPLWIQLPGAFLLMFESQSLLARNFKYWLATEVLPSIFSTGLYSINTASKESLPELLKSLMPNTDPLTVLAMQKRDLDVNNVYDFDLVHSILPYSIYGKRTKTEVVLLACSRSLIYDHDYWYSEEYQEWQLSHVGLEYLIAFARPTNPINLSVFGNSHVVLNLVRFLESESFPQPTNHFAPRLVMEPSALMKAGKIDHWYSISEKGLTFFAEVWKGQNLSVWHEFRQLCSSLDTGRYVKAVRNENSVHKFNSLYLYEELKKRNWIIKTHPESKLLWTLESAKPSLNFS